MYVKSDRDKSRARDRYIIVSIDGEWCFIKTFSGSHLRATSYKVKLAECYTVPHTLPPPSYQSVVPTLDEDECVEIPEQPQPCQEPSSPPDLLLPPNPDPPDSTPDQAEQQEDLTPLETDRVPVSTSCEPRPTGTPAPSIVTGVHSQLVLLADSRSPSGACNFHTASVKRCFHK